MFWFILLMTFFFGLCIGSFVNVVIYRTMKGMSFTKGRSACDHCDRQLSWYENIPLLSYLLLRGRCRTCKQQIPWSYPAVEFTTGLLFVWWISLGFAFFQLTQEPFSLLQPLFWLIVGLLLIIVFYTDLLYQIIPDVITLSLTLLALLYRALLVQQEIMQPIDFAYTIFSAITATSFFLILFLLTKQKGIGFGDVKFAFPMGLILGHPGTLVGIFLAFIYGGVYGSTLLVLKKKKFGQKVPFGPFLIAGLITALLFGDQIWQWYLGLML